MNQLITDIYSPSWWIGVVVVSFVINIASAYAKPLLDRLLARFSDRRRIKLEQSHQKLRRAAELVLSIPDGVVLLSLQEVKLALAAVASLTFCILLILLLFFVTGVDRVLVFVALPVLLVAALVCMHASARKAALLRLVNRMRGQAEV